MRKLRKAAVVAAVLGSVGLLGTGTAYADGGSATVDYSRQQQNQQYDQQQPQQQQQQPQQAQQQPQQQQAQQEQQPQQQSQQSQQAQQEPQQQQRVQQQQPSRVTQSRQQSRGGEDGPGSVGVGGEKNWQSTSCRADDKIVDYYGEVGEGNGDKSKDDAGSQSTTLGSSMNCSINTENSADKK